MSASPPRGRRRDADALLADEYERLKPQILATVSAKLVAGGVRLDAADLDAAYNQAWHGVYTKLAAGEEIENHRGLLVSIAHRRALDEYRALRPGRRAAATELDELPDDGTSDTDLDGRLDAARRLRAFMEGLRDRLDLRERQAAALCYLYGFSRPEAAEALGLRPKRMEKVMDTVSRRLGPVVADIDAGAWCERRASLMKAYALGVLDEDGERHRLASDHLADCSACRLGVLRLRGLAAVAPPAPVLAGLTGGAVVGAAGVGAAAGGGPDGGAGAAGAGEAGRSGASVAHHAAREARRKLVIAGAVTAAVAVAAAALAIGLSGGDDAPTPPPAPVPERAQRADEARAAAADTARRRADARRAAVQRAAARRAAAAARRRAAARRQASATAVPAVPPATLAETPPAAAAEPASPAPAATPPPVAEPAPAPAPQPAAEPAQPSAPQPPVRDGAEEFELR